MLNELFDNLLNKYQPLDIADKLKSAVNGSKLSQYGNFLSQARAYLTNSLALSGSMSSSFMPLPDMVPDFLLDSEIHLENFDPLGADNRVVKVFDDPDESAVFNNLSDFFLFLKTTSTTTVAESNYKGITLTNANGDKFNWIIIPRRAESGYGTVIQVSDDELIHLTAQQLDNSNFRITHEVFTLDTTFVSGLPTNRAAIKGVISDAFGKLYSFWDLVADQSINAELCSSLLQVVDISLTGDLDTTQLVSCINSFVSSSVSAVRELGSKLVSSFSSGGLAGVISVIVDWFKGTAQVDVSDNHLTFTDNASLVPQEFLSGILPTVFTNVLTVATTIATAASRVAGAIAAGLSAIVNFTIQALNFDPATAGTSQLVDSLQSGYAFAPHGLGQMIEEVAPSSSGILTSVKKSKDNGIYSFLIPGGAIVYTYTGDDNVIKAEFHPDLVDRRNLFALNNPRPRSLVDQIVLPDPEPGQDNQTVYYFRVRSSAELLSAVNNLPQSDLTLSNENSGYLSYDNDDIMFRIICCNVCLAYMYLMGLNEDHPNMYFGVSRTDLGYGRNKNCYVWVGATPQTLTNIWSYNMDVNNAPGGNDGVLGDLAACFLCAVMDGYPSGNLEFPYNNHWAWPAHLAGVSSDTYNNQMNSKVVLAGGNVEFYCSPCVILPASALLPVWDDCFQLPSAIVWSLNTPKYNRSTYMRNIIGFTVLTAAVTVVAIVSTAVIRKAVKKKNQKNLIAAEKAWDAAKANPTPENMKAYTKAVKKNNLFAAFTGGKKLDKFDYWGGGSSDSGSLVSKLGSSLTSTSDNVGAIDSTAPNYAEILKLISGH